MALLKWIYVAILAVGTLNGEPVVKSALGTVFGKTDCYESVEVESFLGIPFAKPPLGDLRFAFPQPSGSFGELNATEYSASCPQTRIMPLRPHPESEDCLYLNIYRKAGTQPNSKRPVSLNKLPWEWKSRTSFFLISHANLGQFRKLNFRNSNDERIYARR